MKKFAETWLDAVDVQQLCEQMYDEPPLKSREEYEAFLDEHEEEIAEAMYAAGWYCFKHLLVERYGGAKLT